MIAGSVLFAGNGVSMYTRGVEKNVEGLLYGSKYIDPSFLL